MARYVVRIAATAFEDLREIAAYLIHRDSRVAARRQVAKLRARIRGLANQPGRGRVPPELAERGLQAWREAVLAPWRIIYRIDAGAIHVLAVLDGRRELSELLVRRLTRPG